VQTVTSSAFATAFYFDVELAADVAPFARVVEALFSRKRGLYQFLIPLENTKAQPPKPLDLGKLLERIADGVVSVAAVETPPKTADREQMRVSVSTTPIANRPERFSQTRCRYAFDAQFGAASMDELGAQCVLDAIVAFADAMGARAGIALWADTTIFASSLVTCGGSSQLTREQDRRVLALMDGRSRWGEAIRGPQWGTFLGRTHVEQLGGIARIERESGCVRVVSLASGGAFLQTTTIDAPIVEGHDDGSVLARLAQFLAPVM
jgi:hypothetical protein